MRKNYSRHTEIRPFVTEIDCDQAYKLNHAPQYKSAKQYAEAKLKSLVNDFCIQVKPTEIEHLDALATEIEARGIEPTKAEEAINRAVRQIINNHWK